MQERATRLRKSSRYGKKSKFAALSVTVALLGALVAFILLIHDFLSISKPLESEYLVVEAWITNRETLQDAADWFLAGHCDTIIVAWVSSKEAQPSRAEATRITLRSMGVDDKAIKVIDVPSTSQSRTLETARAVKRYLMSQADKKNTMSINVFSLGVHARKSYVIFRSVFKPEYKVGIVAGTEKGYDTRYWWISPRGTYIVIRNTFGYLFALFLESPSD